MIPHDDLTDESFLALHGFEVEVNEDGEQPWDMRGAATSVLLALNRIILHSLAGTEVRIFLEMRLKYRDMVRYDEKEPDYIRHYSNEGITDIMQTAREKGFFRYV